jgi:DNA-nicking Smr family endonuclease
MTRRRGLSPEEDALWRRVVRDVSPLRRTNRPVPKSLVSDPQGGGGWAMPRPGLIAAEKPAAISRRQGPALGAGSVSGAAPKAEHPFKAGDPRLDRLAGRGRLEIDAVLDLHGHTQATARAAFHRFIVGSHGRGARCLLVITGKGGPGAGEGGAGRGVLRARLADWLMEEPVRRLVARAGPAHQRHGGAGAFYVFLKR